MAVITKTRRGKYAKYRYEAFTALASMTFKLLREQGAWSDITRNSVNASFLTFKAENIGIGLDWVYVYFQGYKVGCYSLDYPSRACFRIFNNDGKTYLKIISLDEKQERFVLKQLQEMIKVKEKNWELRSNQYFTASQKGIFYYLGFSENEEYKFIWGNPRIPKGETL